MSSLSRRNRLKSFAKFLVFAGLLFLFVTNKKMGIMQHLRDFYTLPESDPRVQQMGVGVWVILIGFLSWLVVTMTIAGLLPSGKSTWAWLFWMVVVGLILAQFFFPGIAWVYSQL